VVGEINAKVLMSNACFSLMQTTIHALILLHGENYDLFTSFKLKKSLEDEVSYMDTINNCILHKCVSFNRSRKRKTCFRKNFMLENICVKVHPILSLMQKTNKYKQLKEYNNTTK
jgi:hypothetical protein